MDDAFEIMFRLYGVSNRYQISEVRDRIVLSSNLEYKSLSFPLPRKSFDEIHHQTEPLDFICKYYDASELILFEGTTRYIGDNKYHHSWYFEYKSDIDYSKVIK